MYIIVVFVIIVPQVVLIKGGHFGIWELEAFRKDWTEEKIEGDSFNRRSSRDFDLLLGILPTFSL